MRFLFALLFPTFSFAVTMQDFCQDPIKIVCGPTIGSRQSRNERLKQRINDVRSAAWENVLKVIPDAKWEEIPFDSEEHPSKSLTVRQQQLARIYFEQVNNVLRANIGGLFEYFKPAFEEIRKFMVETVKARVKKDRPADAKKMLKNLDPEKIQFIDAVDVLDHPHANQGELLDHIVESCGKEGLEDNAFAVEIDNDRFIVVCPGEYLAVWDPQQKTGINLQEVSGEVWTLGHEMGHHIDALTFPSSYKKFRSCINDSYASELALKDSAEYMGEISADYWGTETLAGLLFNVKSEQERLSLLQDSLDSLCDTPDDNIHPDGRFRIENFVRRNPRLSQVLGCKADPKISFKPSCTLRGAWKERFW
jgi:hypothetical protein